MSSAGSVVAVGSLKVVEDVKFMLKGSNGSCWPVYIALIILFWIIFKGEEGLIEVDSHM
jgi:hypothetical protein